MSRTRVYRRWKMELLKRRVRRYGGAREYNEYMQERPTSDPARIGRLAQTRKPCSCDMCGNLRRWEGQTRQERRAGVSFVYFDYDAWAYVEGA